VAAATAGCAAFIVAAAVDWTWEVTVVPVAFLALAAVILGGRPRSPGIRGGRRARVLGGALAALSAVAALVAIALPLASTSSIRDSQRHFTAGRLSPALEDARTAQRVLPAAAAPHLQEAFVLERAHRLAAAAAAARSAVSKEPTYWINWLVLSRIEAKRGHAKQSVRAYLKAKELKRKLALSPG
jgi:tetratricopeptide (TPR) repeat protein